MHKVLALLVCAATIAGCSGVKKTFGIKDTPPAHREPRSTSIFGDWVLDNIDSTAFAGASQVDLSLQETGFTLVATYPNQASTIVTGAASLNEGTLTLTPSAGTAVSNERLRGVFTAGKPIVVTASAAGGSLVFARPPSITEVAVTPSSSWHKKSQAKAAGIVR